MTAPIGMPEALGTLMRGVDRVQGGTGASPAAATSEAGATSFAERLEQVVESANATQVTADRAATDFAEGRTNDLHGTMIAMNQADISLHFVTSIRNKMIEAYREVMRMGA